MSNEENVNKTEENVNKIEENVNKSESSMKSVAGNLVSSILNLKEKNPKVFFGAIGGVVVLLIIIMASGGDSSSSVSGPAIKNLVVGQKYVLKSPNTYDKAATIRLVAVPGTIAAYDDTEEDDRTGVCKHMPQGTPVTVTDLQDFSGKKNAFAKVQMLEGECQGKDGWVLSINVQ
ncbi:hypothetical protein [Methylobacter luteus]|uniref:hypothetical protein n=1 Tax=Methylobacter luteus TaxID=415 RepID=UPI00040B81B6|nr:hypothetical protein [Methylobacter luteus]